MRKTYYQEGKRVATIDKTNDINFYHLAFINRYIGKFPDLEAAENRIKQSFPGAVVGENVLVDDVVKLINTAILEYDNSVTNQKMKSMNAEFTLGKIFGLLKVLECYDLSVFCDVYKSIENDISFLTEQAEKIYK